MGLVIKPSKCASLSIQSGKSTGVNFYLTGNGHRHQIELIRNKPQKFLGSIVTALNKPQDMFQFLYDKLSKKLQNIDNSSLRGEHKMKIYSRYALISMRYHLSVHDIHKTHLDKLDSIARKYLKKWLNIPSHGASDISIFHPYVLGLKAPSHLYQESHAGNYTIMRLKGDEVVNHTLNSRLERESDWTCKSSTITFCDNILKQNIENDQIFIPTPTNTFNVAASVRHEIPKAKVATKKSIQEYTTNQWNTKVEKLIMQGDFTKLLIEEKEDVTWKSIIYNIPKGVLSFALNSATNTLPTPDNLRRWGKRMVSVCPLCSNQGTLEHILNFCSVALNQGRYTWRHNTVLNHIANTILQNKPSHVEVYSDISGLDINGGTIPPDIVVTQLRPDLVIINRQEKIISLLELTCSFEKNAEAANLRKTLRYNALKSDLEDRGYRCLLVPFEVGSRGHIRKASKSNILNIFLTFNISARSYQCVKNMSKLSLLSSYTIFNAYTQPSWRDPPFLTT